MNGTKIREKSKKTNISCMHWKNIVIKVSQASLASGVKGVKDDTFWPLRNPKLQNIRPLTSVV